MHTKNEGWRGGIALKLIESIKWYLWHGNVFQALEQLESLSMDLESADFESSSETTRKLLQAINEFHSYIERNRAFTRTMANDTATAKGSVQVLSNRR